MARFRGDEWGGEDATPDSRVAWHECKSDVDVNFSVYATEKLDYYHASQHLGVLADALFGSDEDLAAKEAWLAQHRRELTAVGPANLIKTLS